MSCCYIEDCGEYGVTPILVSSCVPAKCCEEPPACYPCLPRRCKNSEVVYCCEKRPSRSRKSDDCNHDRRRESTPPPQQTFSRSSSRQTSSSTPPNCCPTCCRPMKTKYVIPCYRYEDGRIERYVPTKYGRLPNTAYQRNGIQDQMHGYRGAVRYLCAAPTPLGCCVHTIVEPLKKYYSKITKEVLPVKRKKDKK